MATIDRDQSEKIRNKLQFAYECLFERICLNIESSNHKKSTEDLGIIFLDNNGVKGVQSWFSSFYQDGTRYVSNKYLIESAVVLKMSESNLLQIADMIVCTHTYLLKAQNGQKASLWVKDTLELGLKSIKGKCEKVKAQNQNRTFSSFKMYANN